MGSKTPFAGFPKKTITFLKELRKNNNKEWFAANKDDFDNHVMAPSREFVVAMGARLRKLSPEVEAVPKVNGSLFRINRDTRFSKDKSPYKTNLGIFFWEGPRKKMECSGYYFHLEPNSLMIGVGMYMFPKELLSVYRDAVVDKKLGPALKKAVKKMPVDLFTGKGCAMPIDAYKKVPAGYDPDHSMAEFLKYKGLHCGVQGKIPKELHSDALLDYCYEQYKQLAPLHKWLVKAL